MLAAPAAAALAAGIPVGSSGFCESMLGGCGLLHAVTVSYCSIISNGELGVGARSCDE